MEVSIETSPRPRRAALVDSRCVYPKFRRNRHAMTLPADLRARLESDPWAESLGVEYLALEPGYCRGGLALQPHMVNFQGSPHGGGDLLARRRRLRRCEERVRAARRSHPPTYGDCTPKPTRKDETFTR